MRAKRMGLMTAALGVLLAAGGLMVAQEEGRPKRAKARAARQPRVKKQRGPRLRGLWAKLDLTDEQKTKYAELDKDRMAKLKELQEQIKAVHKAFEDAMLAELTEEQKAARQQLLDEEKKKQEERRAKARERMKARGGRKTPKPKPETPTSPDVPDEPDVPDVE